MTMPCKKLALTKLKIKTVQFGKNKNEKE